MKHLSISLFFILTSASLASGQGSPYLPSLPPSGPSKSIEFLPPGGSPSLNAPPGIPPGNPPGNPPGIPPSIPPSIPFDPPPITSPSDLPSTSPSDLPAVPLDMPEAPQADLPLDLAPQVFRTSEIDEWFSWESWDASFELGINGVEGNSQSLSLLSGFEIERKTKHHEARAKLRYAMARTASIETQNNAQANFGYERLMHQSPWSMFVKNDLLYDRFKPFDLRFVLNGGMAFKHIDDDITLLKSRFGAGASNEFGGPDDSWTPEAILGLDYKRQLTKKQKLTASLEYFPEWGRFSDFRFVSDLAWVLLLDAEANMSLKVSILDQYDSTPNGAKPNDINYAILLLWKL